MTSIPKATNPFYGVLVVVGVLFLLTATSYFVVTLQGRRTALWFRAAQPAHSFVFWMELFGFTALMVELGVLAAATIAAIGTDDYWTRRAAAASHESSAAPEPAAAEDKSPSDQP